MKFYQKRGFACVVLVLAILFAGYWGISHKPTDTKPAKHAELLDVKYQQWICDEAKVLSDKTENTIESYNDAWDQQHYAVLAVATVKSISGWEMEDYAAALGSKWGLGGNDMLLLLATEGSDANWYVSCGDNVLSTMTDTQQTKLKQAIDKPFFSGKYDEAVTAFFRQADVFYGQADLMGGSASWEGSQEYEDYYPQQQSGTNFTGVIVMLVAFFVVWMLLDRLRYNRYRRRYVKPAVVVRPVYYPIFWGRSLYRPVRPAAPRPPRAPVSHTTRPSRPTQSRPTSPPRHPTGGSAPRGKGGFGGGGFGGKHR